MEDDALPGSDAAIRQQLEADLASGKIAADAAEKALDESEVLCSLKDQKDSKERY